MPATVSSGLAVEIESESKVSVPDACARDSRTRYKPNLKVEEPLLSASTVIGFTASTANPVPRAGRRHAR